VSRAANTSATVGVAARRRVLSQKRAIVRRVRGTSHSDTLLAPWSRGRCATGISVTANPSRAALASISVFTKKPRLDGIRWLKVSRRNTFKAQSQSRTPVPSQARASTL